MVGIPRAVLRYLRGRNCPSGHLRLAGLELATIRTSWSESRPVLGLDIEARPGPWGGKDFTFRHMLSLALGYSGDAISYLAPGFLKYELERAIMPLREGNLLVVAHNARYDLNGLNGMMMKLGLQPLPPQLVCDTWADVMKHGFMFSKSLGNMAQRFGVPSKGHMSEVDWERVYEGDPEALEKLKLYNCGDVSTVLALRVVLLERGILKPPRRWAP